MLNEGVAYGKEAAARAQRKRRPKAGVRERGETLIELGKFCRRRRDVRAREFRKRRLKFRAQAKSRHDPAQMDDLGPD